MLTRLLVGLADVCRRNAVAIVLAGIVLAGFCTWVAMHGLGISTDTDQMFATSLPWRQRAIQFNKDFPQFSDLLVAVIDAKIPEEADSTAAALAAKLAADHAHFISVRRPDASPYLQKEGLLLLETQKLSDLMDRTIDAQPFLGQLVADPTARGLFSALSLLGMGVTHGDADLTPYLGPIRGFHQALADALAGHPQPLSWESLLGGNLSDLAGKYRFVLCSRARITARWSRAAKRRRSCRRTSPSLSSSRRDRRECASPGRWHWPTHNSPRSRRAPSPA